MVNQRMGHQCGRIFISALLFSSLGLDRICSADPPITALAFSLKQRQLMAGSQKGMLVLEWPGLKQVRLKDCELDSIHDISVSPDEKHVLVAGGSPGSSGVVQMRSWPELELEQSWNEHQDVVYKVAWRADGQEWVSASWDGFCKVCSWNAKASRIIMTSHSGPVFDATYVLDGSVATAGGDGTIVVWKPGSGETVRVLRQHTGTVHALALQPVREGNQERLLASASVDRTVRFWQPNVGRLVRFHRFPSTPRSIAWTRDGRSLIVGCDDGLVVQLDPVSLTSAIASQRDSRVLSIVADLGDNLIAVSTGSNVRAIERPE